MGIKTKVVEYTALLTAGITLLGIGGSLLEKEEYQTGSILTAMGIVLIGIYTYLISKGE